MLTSIFALQALALADTVTPATTDRVVNWAIQAPLTVAFFLLLGAIGYIGRWVIRDAFPKWLEENAKTRSQREAENEKTRLHLEGVLDKRGAEASRDVASAHTIVGDRVEAMHSVVVDVSGKVDKVDGKVDAVHVLIRAIASKQGLGVLVLLLLSSAAAAVGSRLITTSLAYSCDPKCDAPSYCCKTDVCCRNASATACQPVPHSDRVVRYDYGDEPWSEIDALRASSL